MYIVSFTCTVQSVHCTLHALNLYFVPFSVLCAFFCTLCLISVHIFAFLSTLYFESFICTLGLLYVKGAFYLAVQDVFFTNTLCLLSVHYCTIHYLIFLNNFPHLILPK